MGGPRGGREGASGAEIAGFAVCGGAEITHAALVALGSPGPGAVGASRAGTAGLPLPGAEMSRGTGLASGGAGCGRGVPRAADFADGRPNAT